MTETTVEPLYARPKADPAPLRRIRRLAWPFEIGFAALAIMTGALFVLILAAAYVPGGYVTFNAEGGWLTTDPSTAPPDALPVTAFPLAAQLAGLVLGGIIYGALVKGLWSLHRLFGLYRRGEVFSSGAIGLMRQSGIALVVFAAAPGLAQPLMHALGSPDRNWFHGETIPLLIVGAGLFVFAHIIALGVELQRESKGFI